MKIVVFVKDREIISAFEHEGNTEIVNDKSSVYIDTAENLLLILPVLGVKDVSKLEIFMT